MIILAECCTGKSTLSKKLPQVVDLENYLFYKENNQEIDYDLWVRHLFEAGVYRNFIACAHANKQVRKILTEKHIPYILVFPEDSLKEEYFNKIIKRGSSLKLAYQVKDNWSERHTVYDGENVIYLSSNQYIMDILPELESKWENMINKEELQKLNEDFKKKFSIL